MNREERKKIIDTIKELSLKLAIGYESHLQIVIDCNYLKNNVGVKITEILK